MALASQNLQVIFNGQDIVSGKDIKNVMFYRALTYDASNRDPQAGICASFATLFIAQWIPLLSFKYNLVSILVRNLDDPGDLGENVPVGQVGAVTGDYLPSDNAFVVNWLSNTRGKTGRGKTHFALVPEDNTRGNLIEVATIVPATKAAAAAWLAANITGSVGVNIYKLHVWQATATAGNFTPSGIKSVQVTSYKLNAMIGGMKRRKQRGVYA